MAVRNPAQRSHKTPIVSHLPQTASFPNVPVAVSVFDVHHGDSYLARDLYTSLTAAALVRDLSKSHIQAGMMIQPLCSQCIRRPRMSLAQDARMSLALAAWTAERQLCISKALVVVVASGSPRHHSASGTSIAEKASNNLNKLALSPN